MKLEVQMPDPRFAVGDALRLDGLVAVVQGWLIQGRWLHSPETGMLIENLYSVYRLVAQQGSMMTQGMFTMPTPVRPGTLHDLDMKLVDKKAVPIQLPFQPVSGDRAETILERHQAWAATLPPPVIDVPIDPADLDQGAAGGVPNA